MFVKTHHFHNRHRYHTIASNERVASQQCNQSQTNQHLKNKAHSVATSSSHQITNSSPKSGLHNHHHHNSQQQQPQSHSTAHKHQQAPQSSSQKQHTDRHRYHHHSQAAQEFRQQQQHSLPAPDSLSKQIGKTKKISKSDAYLSPILRTNKSTVAAAAAHHHGDAAVKVPSVASNSHSNSGQSNRLRTAHTLDNDFSGSAQTIRGVTSDSDISNQHYYLRATKLSRSLSIDSYILSIKHDKRGLLREQQQTGCCCARDATTYALKQQQHQRRYHSENNKHSSNNSDKQWYRLCEQCYIKHIEHFVLSNSSNKNKSNNKSKQRLGDTAHQNKQPSGLDRAAQDEQRPGDNNDNNNSSRSSSSSSSGGGGGGAPIGLNSPKKLVRSTSLTTDNRLIDRANNFNNHYSPTNKTYLIERTLSNSCSKSTTLNSITSSNLSACKVLLELSGKLFKNLWILDLRNIHLFGLFCENFFAYQFETLRSSFVSLHKQTTGASRRATNTVACSRTYCCRQLKRQQSQMGTSFVESIGSEFDTSGQQPMQQQQPHRRAYSSIDYCREDEERNNDIGALQVSLSSHSLNDDHFSASVDEQTHILLPGSAGRAANHDFCYANYAQRPVEHSWLGADPSRPQTSAGGVVFNCGDGLVRCDSRCLAAHDNDNNDDYLLTGSLIGAKHIAYGRSSSLQVRSRVGDLINEYDVDVDAEAEAEAEAEADEAYEADQADDDRYSDTGVANMRTRLSRYGCGLHSVPMVGPQCYAVMPQPADQPYASCSAQSPPQCDLCVDLISPSPDWPREPITPLMSPQASGEQPLPHGQPRQRSQRSMSAAHRYSVAVTHSPPPLCQSIDGLDPCGNSSLDEDRYVRIAQAQAQAQQYHHHQHRHNHRHQHHHHRHHLHQSNHTRQLATDSLTSIARSDPEPCQRISTDRSQPMAVQKTSAPRHNQSTQSGSNNNNIDSNNDSNPLPSVSPQSVSSGQLGIRRHRWPKSAASVDNYQHFAPRTGVSARVGFIESGRSISVASSDVAKGASGGAGGAQRAATNPPSSASGGSRNSTYFGSVDDVIRSRSMSQSGAKRRLGFKQRFSGDSNKVLNINRSEEIVPSGEMLAELANRQPVTWAESFTISERTGQFSESFDSSIGSQTVFARQSTRTGTNDGDHSNSGATKLAAQDPRANFVDGLGAGQMASRQALVAPYLGDIQLGISDQRGMLEVEIVQARHLQAKPGAVRMPSPYVKVYLMRDKKCIAKFKTAQMRQTLDPVFKQLFIFRDSYKDCVLQTIVWGDYGKRDRKTLMGVVQVHLNDLDTKSDNRIFGWYRLFNASSMAPITSPSTATSSKTNSVIHETKSLDTGTDQQRRQVPDDKNSKGTESCKRMRQLAYKQQQRSTLTMMLSTTLIGASGCSSKQLRQTISASKLCSSSIGPTEEGNCGSINNNNETNDRNRNHHHETSSLSMKPDRHNTNTNTNYTDTPSNQSTNIVPVKQQQQRPLTDHR